MYVDVPTATIMPTSLAPGGVLSNPCAYLGYQLDFAPDKLKESYASHNGTGRRCTGGSSPRSPRAGRALRRGGRSDLPVFVVKLVERMEELLLELRTTSHQGREAPGERRLAAPEAAREQIAAARASKILT